MSDDQLAGFIDAEYPRLIGALGFYVRDKGVAEELAQEALVRLWQNWSRVSRLQNPSAWLHRVAINLANSRFRRLVAERKAQTKMGTEYGAGRTHVDAADAYGIRQAVARLPNRQRSAVVLRFYLELPFSEVAEILDVPLRTAQSLVARGVARLREHEDLGQLTEVWDG